MDKLELTEAQANLILIVLFLFVLSIGVILGIFLDEMWNIEKFKISVQQTKCEYLHLPNGTLWKKVKEVKND